MKTLLTISIIPAYLVLFRCNTSDPTSEIEATVTAGGSSLTSDPATGQYNYVWKTNSAWKGTCRQLIVKLNDGTRHTANFQFK